MGDAGSMVLGLLLAWFAIELAGREASPLAPIGAVWILAVPLLNMGAVLCDRVRHHESPFAADHRHFHHLLADGGMPVPRTVAFAVTAATLAGAVGVGLPLLGVPEWALFAAFGAALACACRCLARTYARRTLDAGAARARAARLPHAVAVDEMAHE
jgi:UDP-GlcNAc:undecaprenyl-phosphate GlcNAc-1-phosphate transferase